MSARADPGRRAALAALAALALPRPASADGSGAFQCRLLSTGGARPSGVRASGAVRWAWEVARRTSAPARMVRSVVRADQRALLAEPFVLWTGGEAVPALTGAERRGLERFLRMGGMLVVDDAAPSEGSFGRSVRAELAQVLSEAVPVPLEPTHVLFKSFYIVERPIGRVEGPEQIDAIVRGGTAQVLFLQHDLLGALAREPAGGWSLDVTPGGARQRQLAVRFAVNITLYLLCSDYKDDQVHAKWILQRRARLRR